VHLVAGHGALGVVRAALAGRHLHLLGIALLQDGLDHLILVLGVEFGGHLDFRGTVVVALSTLLVGDKDLEAGDKVSQGDAGVALPLVVGLDIINKDNEVLVGALVVDLGLGSLASNHFCGLFWSGAG
jgi:hypothetical protein